MEEEAMEGWVWFTLAGLVSDIAGAAILVSGLLITEERAIELTATRLASDTREGNLRHPAAQDRLAQSSRARVGLGFLVVGFLLQAAGSVMSAVN
jgi:hypothetical protein